MITVDRGLAALFTSYHESLKSAERQDSGGSLEKAVAAMEARVLGKVLAAMVEANASPSAPVGIRFHVQYMGKGRAGTVWLVATPIEFEVSHGDVTVTRFLVEKSEGNSDAFKDIGVLGQFVPVGKNAWTQSYVIDPAVPYLAKDLVGAKEVAEALTSAVLRRDYD